MTLDEAIEIFKLDKHETNLNVSGLYNINIITWLEELKKYRLFTEKCASSSYTVNSNIFAEHIKDFIEDKEVE